MKRILFAIAVTLSLALVSGADNKESGPQSRPGKFKGFLFGSDSLQEEVPDAIAKDEPAKEAKVWLLQIFGAHGCVQSMFLKEKPAFENGVFSWDGGEHGEPGMASGNVIVRRMEFDQAVTLIYGSPKQKEITGQQLSR